MKNCVLALGFFDSIHIGHRFLLQKAKEIAVKKQTKLVVLTFDDSFLTLLNRNAKEVYLFAEKKQILLDIGVDLVDILPSTTDFLHYDKVDFLNYIQNKYQPLDIVAGSDYTFGHKAQGNADFLQTFFKNSKISVHIYSLLTQNSSKIASTTIRSLIESGEIEQANSLLLQPFFISGKVEHGYKIGSKINFPTANMSFNEHKLIPNLGVYYVIVEIDNIKYKGIANIGNRPTFNGQKIKIETHILDFNQTIYDKEIKVYLIKYLREIVKFENETQLTAQIAQDIIRVKNEVEYDKVWSSGQQ